MKKCYIAGSITGTTDFKERFNVAEWEVLALGMEPVNPVELPHLHNKKWESYMKECINALMGCDAIYLLHDWNKSAGAKVEAEIAKKLNYDHFYQTELDNKNCPKKSPITTIGMTYKANWYVGNEKWEITDSKGKIIAMSEAKVLPSFKVPSDWLVSRTYQVELKIQEGCSNNDCSWTCNGCVAKIKAVDYTNNLVTIINYI